MLSFITGVLWGLNKGDLRFALLASLSQKTGERSPGLIHKKSGYQPKAGQDQEKSGGELRTLFAFIIREQIPLRYRLTSTVHI